MIYITQNC